MWEIVGMRASMFSVEQKQKEREKKTFTRKLNILGYMLQ